MTDWCTQADYDAVEAAYARQAASHKPPSMTAPEYRGLYGEVVGHDCYDLRDLGFVPDVILDIGANVGVFTRFARELFPKAAIIAVEPDEVNFRNLLALTPDRRNLVSVKKALGTGRIWKLQNAPNGAHLSYLSETHAQSAAWFRSMPKQFVPSDVESVMLDALCREYAPANSKVFVKIDCEGAEYVMLEHPPSLKALGAVEAFAIELHGHGDDMLRKLFSKTHTFKPTVAGVLRTRKKAIP